jgi:septal ring factor EnvC (AmiA/AmiB activator)
MLVDVEKVRVLEQENRELAAKLASVERTVSALQNAVIRFGSRVARCDDRITKLEAR